MLLSELQKALTAKQGAALRFRLPDSSEVAAHFHVTEVAHERKTFVDCGGTKRRHARVVLQLWVAYDYEHRLHAGKLHKILEIADGDVLPKQDLEVEIQHQVGSLTKYNLASVTEEADSLVFQLAAIAAECLAPDKCGVSFDQLPPLPGQGGACLPGSGCC